MATNYSDGLSAQVMKDTWGPLLEERLRQPSILDHLGYTPPPPPTGWRKVRVRVAARAMRLRQAIALRIAPWLEDSGCY